MAGDHQKGKGSLARGQRAQSQKRRGASNKDANLHNRLVPLVEIRISDIKVDENFEHDNLFIKHFQNYILGKKVVALTRIHEAQIISGFLRRSGSGFEIVSQPKPQFVASGVRDILGGERRTLLVYGAIDGSGRYVCPDDEVALAAYREVGINYVPCILLNPGKQLTDFPLIYLRASAEGPTKYVGARTATREHLIGYNLAGKSFAERIALLLKRTWEAAEAVRSFHKTNSSNLHYHHRIYHTLRSHAELLDTILHLISRNRMPQAMALTRVAYEGFLNFNIDWLAPSYIGPRMQLLSHIRDRESALRRKQGVAEKEDMAVFGGIEYLLENVAQKAELSLLGRQFHEITYHSMSSVSHQAYGELEDSAVDFHAEDPALTASQTAGLAEWLNVITASLTYLALDEVGLGFSVSR